MWKKIKQRETVLRESTHISSHTEKRSGFLPSLALNYIYLIINCLGTPVNLANGTDIRFSALKNKIKPFVMTCCRLNNFAIRVRARIREGERKTSKAKSKKQKNNRFMQLLERERKEKQTDCLSFRRVVKSYVVGDTRSLNVFRNFSSLVILKMKVHSIYFS